MKMTLHHANPLLNNRLFIDVIPEPTQQNSRHCYLTELILLIGSL